MPVFKQNQVFAGRYLLSQLLGEGGFSEVWKATDQMSDAIVAIKIYAPSKGLDDFGLRQFRNEFSLTHHLTHPHLLKVYHYDIADASPYLIMPFCPFGSLTQVLMKEGVLSEKKVALVMYQIGSALAELHAQAPPIVHQDIKPDNILLMNPETFMLADFGISSRIRFTLKQTVSDAQAITYAYAPPERFDHQPISVPSGDIFSLGVSLYEMCTNTVPWNGVGGQALLKGASVPALPKGFSAELNEILQLCMSLDRTKRPSAAEIQQRARHYLDTGSWRLPRQKKKKIRSTALVSSLATAAVALLAIAVLGTYKIQSNQEENQQEVFTPSAIADKIIALLDDKPNSDAKPGAERVQETEETQYVKVKNESLEPQDPINQPMAQNSDADTLQVSTPKTTSSNTGMKWTFDKSLFQKIKKRLSE